MTLGRPVNSQPHQLINPSTHQPSLPGDVALRVDGVSKKFCKRLRRSMAYGIMDLSKNLVGIRPDTARLRKDEFWAVDKVSFELRRGERIGIIGANGSGKSTLLRLLAGIFPPDKGTVMVRGRVGVLIALGAGFHPHMTGRENIYLNGTILGMKGSDIDAAFDDIVSFAEIEDFLDTPLSAYSSGMRVRLGFAVAAHLDPDILIVDEVLSVGDERFRKRCLGMMGDAAEHGRSVVFVSHNMGAVATLCPRSILLSHGAVLAEGPTHDVISEYLSQDQEDTGERVWNDPQSAPGNEKARLHAIRILSDGKVTANVNIEKDVTVEMEYWNLCPDASMSTSMHLLDSMGYEILASGNMPSASLGRDEWFGKPRPVGHYRSTCTLPGNFLNEGRYNISAFVVTDMSHLDVEERSVISFDVHDTGGMRKEYCGQWIGALRPRLAWHTDLLGEAEVLAVEDES